MLLALANILLLAVSFTFQILIHFFFCFKMGHQRESDLISMSRLISPIQYSKAARWREENHRENHHSWQSCWLLPTEVDEKWESVRDVSRSGVCVLRCRCCFLKGRRCCGAAASGVMKVLMPWNLNPGTNYTQMTKRQSPQWKPTLSAPGLEAIPVQHLHFTSPSPSMGFNSLFMSVSNNRLPQDLRCQKSRLLSQFNQSECRAV